MIKAKEKKKMADYKDREAKVAVSQCPVEGDTVQLMTLQHESEFSHAGFKAGLS